MSAALLFPILNLVALAGWIALLASPFAPRLSQQVAAYAIPLMLAVAYSAIILAYWSGAEGGFGSLDEVSLLFQSSELLLAGWVHYLAFDLFVGAWIVREAAVRGVPFWQVVPCLALTFLFGPVGFLLFHALAFARARVRTVVGEA